MTEIEINRANHLIDPHLHIWGWEIPVYLFLGGVTAGLMIFSALLAWRTPEGERSAWARWLPLSAPVVLSLGMLALFMDLEFKQHVYRFFLSFEVTSPMSWGSWILVAVYPVTLLLGLAQLTDDEAARLAAWAPLRVTRLGGLVTLGRRWGGPWTAQLRWASLVLGISLGAYTGILLGTLGARPVWSSAILGPLFMVSGFSTGAALIMLLPVSHAEHGVLRRWDIGAIMLELGLLALFFLGLATAGDAGWRALQLFFGGGYTATFWALVVTAGLAVPLAIEAFASVRGLRPTYVAPLLLLVGGLSLRWILVAAGQA
jgi:protein NrfD